MRKLVLLFALTAAFAGCSPSSSPVELPPGATLEVYTIAAAEASDTTEAIDPGTGGPLYLQTPPILTTTDIANVARSVAEYGTASGARATQPALTVELTPAGSAKMATATATPTGKPIAVLINGQVVATPTMMSPIRESFQISGGSNDERFTSAVEALAKP
jgi:preprotein translocase subunit SecD